MPSGVKRMGIRDKIGLAVSVLSLLVAFISLSISDSVSDLIQRADVVAIQDSTKLDGLVSSSGYINTLNLRNRGNAASKNISVLIYFKSKVPDFELSSDEDIGEREITGSRLKIRLDRLSINSSIKITMFSNLPVYYDMSYIDDNGNHKITIDTDTAQRSLVDIILLLVLIVSLLAIVWIYRRASESALMDILQSHQNEIQERLREVRDEISNIEVVVNDPNGSVSSGPDDKGIGQRLADFMSKI